MFDSKAELLRQIQLGEDNAIELKRVKFKGDKISGPGREELADEIAAIANTQDAVLILGVDDKTRDITGIPLEKLDRVEEYIRSICNDSIKPSLMARTYRLELPDMNGDMQAILKVEIPRGLFIHKSPGGYFYRLGSSKREMPPDILARMFQQRSQARLIHFDEQAVSMTTWNVLTDWKRFASRFNEPHESTLRKRNILVSTESGQTQASVAGLLMCCNHPETYMPNAFIEAVRYRGIDQDTNYQLDAQQITGTLDKQIDQAMLFVKKNQKISAQKTPHRIDLPQFDTRAVFEAILNAVAHRDYSIYGSKIRLFMFDDRMEIYSPGALPNTVSIDTMRMRQSTRNELITSLLAECPVEDKEIGRTCYMEKRGDGVPVIITRSEQLSGRTPEYQLLDNTELLLIIYGGCRGGPS